MEIELKHILLVIIIYLLLQKTMKEGFALFEQRRGLRGEKWNTYDIANNFFNPMGQFKLSPSGYFIYESGRKPIESKCQEVRCPASFREEADIAKCWKCD